MNPVRDTIPGNHEFDVGSAIYTRRTAHKGYDPSCGVSSVTLPSVPIKQRNASSGMQTIGSLLTFKLVFTRAGAAGARLEGGEQRVITRVCLFVNCLDTRRHVDMSNSRDFRADGIEFFDPKKLFVFVRHRVTPVLKDIGNDEHVRAVAIDLEPISQASRNTEGAKGRKLSRSLIFRFSCRCMWGERGSPRIDRAPRALGPNSIRPWNQPTAFSSISASTVCSISASSSTILKTAPALRNRSAISAFEGGPKIGPLLGRLNPKVELIWSSKILIKTSSSSWPSLQKHGVQVSTIVCRVSDAGGVAL